jgi:hypothetical protein
MVNCGAYKKHSKFHFDNSLAMDLSEETTDGKFIQNFIL